MSAIDAYGRGRGLAAVVARNLSTYWSYFNPAFLFLTGGPSLNAATGQAGVFLLPLVVLLPVGIATLLMRADLGAMKWILLIGFFLAPLPPTLKGESHVIQRTLGMLPFAIAISTIGVWALWRVRSIVTRVMVVFLLIAMPVQFAFFYDDYLTDYRLRSASAYDRTAFVETANVLLNADSQSAVAGNLSDGAAVRRQREVAVLCHQGESDRPADAHPILRRRHLGDRSGAAWQPGGRRGRESSHRLSCCGWRLVGRATSRRPHAETDPDGAQKSAVKAGSIPVFGSVPSPPSPAQSPERRRRCGNQRTRRPSRAGDRRPPPACLRRSGKPASDRTAPAGRPVPPSPDRNVANI